MSGYQIAERFKSIQGEGVYAGTPMAFIRFVGCSVGKKICHGCDTDFEREHAWHGGGLYGLDQLMKWACDGGMEHICLTGGEPLDQELRPFFEHAAQYRAGNGRGELRMIHVETSGTVELPDWLLASTSAWASEPRAWICVSPKPGYRQHSLENASEVKIIVPGLGSGEGWPSLEDAVAWARRFSHPVFVQPRNLKHEISAENLALCQQLVLQHPQLRLSVQLHKLLRVR